MGKLNKWRNSMFRHSVVSCAGAGFGSGAILYGSIKFLFNLTPEDSLSISFVRLLAGFLAIYVTMDCMKSQERIHSPYSSRDIAFAPLRRP